MTAPLVPGRVYGLRTWVVTADERLAAPYQGTVWPAGGEPVVAACAEVGHAAPAAGCRCGVYAWHPTPRAAKRVLQCRFEVPGIVEAWGAVDVHADGFRAERARVHALVAHPDRHPARVRRLATAYGAPVLELKTAKDLLLHCRREGLGLDPRTVEDLLADELRRARAERRAHRRTTVRRAALALAAAGAVAVPAWPAIEDVVTDRPNGPVAGRAPPVEDHRGRSGTPAARTAERSAGSDVRP